MKKENDPFTDHMENIPDGQPVVKPNKKEAKPKKERKEKKSFKGIRLPLLVEFTYTVSILILIVLALMVFTTSLLAGASLFTTLIRTGIAIIVMGTLLILISSQISSGLLFSVKIEQEEEQRRQEEAASSINNQETVGAEAEA